MPDAGARAHAPWQDRGLSGTRLVVGEAIAAPASDVDWSCTPVG